MASLVTPIYPPAEIIVLDTLPSDSGLHILVNTTSKDGVVAAAQTGRATATRDTHPCTCFSLILFVQKVVVKSTISKRTRYRTRQNNSIFIFE
jgi:hypothetical protein